MFAHEFRLDVRVPINYVYISTLQLLVSFLFALTVFGWRAVPRGVELYTDEGCGAEEVAEDDDDRQFDRLDLGVADDPD